MTVIPKTVCTFDIINSGSVLKLIQSNGAMQQCTVSSSQTQS